MDTSGNLIIGAGYVRVSTDEQTELSPDAQVRVIQERAKADGVIIPKEFIFIERKGISGRKADNRPEFQRMIAIAKSAKPAPFQRLYLWKFSRFARNQEESTFYKGILRKKCGIEIVSVSEPITEGMFGRLIETIIEWFDEYYSVNLSGEVQRGMKEKALKQGYQLRPILGYEAVGEGKPYTINESEYAIAEFIFAEYHNGLDMNGIARKANARGYRTKTGKLFDRRAIYRILTNRFYVGDVVWNGITFQGTHEIRESITSIFDSTQKRIAAEYKPIRRREVSVSAHWLSGLLQCGYCGGNLGYNRSNTKQHPSFFQCWRYAKGMHSGSCSISVSRAEAAVIESLRQVISSEEIEYEYVPRKDPSAGNEEKLLREALARIAIKERRIREAYENEIDTLEEYKENRQRIRKEREELERAIDLINHASDGSDAPTKDDLLRNIRTVYDLLVDENVDYATKGNALRSVVKNIVFDRKNDRFYVHYYIS